MTSVAAINERYCASESVASGGLNLFVIADAPGARLNDCIRRIARTSVEDGSGLWENVLGAAKSLRWRLVFRPQPLEFNPSISMAARSLNEHAARVRPALGREGAKLLDELTTAAREAALQDPLVGAHLLEAIAETGAQDCLIVTDGSTSRSQVGSWLGPMGFRVVSPGMLTDSELTADVAYVVGPPRLMRASLVTAPPTPEVSFFMPAWFSDLTLPTSAIADFAEGAMRPKARVFRIGEIEGDDETEADSREPVDDFAPQPAWGQHESVQREPDIDEVRARKVLVSGGLALWMDDGERIRTLDSSQLAGERVTYTDVAAVQPGTYLVLRLGSTERAALYEQTLQLMGERGAVVKKSQELWKSVLLHRLGRLGRRTVETQLRQLGVNATEQVAAWIEPTLARPQRDSDFSILLQWLDVPHQPAFANATEFRRARSRAAARIRDQLERAMSSADMNVLRREGHVKVDGEGFASIIATRVLAISPYTNVVVRHDVRVPFPDGGGEWLE